MAVMFKHWLSYTVFGIQFFGYLIASWLLVVSKSNPGVVCSGTL